MLETNVRISDRLPLKESCFGYQPRRPTIQYLEFLIPRAILFSTSKSGISHRPSNGNSTGLTVRIWLHSNTMEESLPTALMFGFRRTAHISPVDSGYCGSNDMHGNQLAAIATERITPSKGVISGSPHIQGEGISCPGSA